MPPKTFSIDGSLLPSAVSIIHANDEAAAMKQVKEIEDGSEIRLLGRFDKLPIWVFLHVDPGSHEVTTASNEGEIADAD